MLYGVYENHNKCWSCGKPRLYGEERLDNAICLVGLIRFQDWKCGSQPNKPDLTITGFLTIEVTCMAVETFECNSFEIDQDVQILFLDSIHLEFEVNIR